MDTILKRVQEVDSNNSEAIKEVLSVFFQHLLKDKASDDNQWLKVLEGTICRFPKYCMSHRTTIENYLITCLDSTNYYDVIEAAKCCQALQQVRPPQNNTATPKLCWREQMQFLCDAAQKLSATLYSNPSHKYGSKDTTESCQPNYLKNTPLILSLVNIATVKTQAHNKHGVLSTRLKNILIFIQAMLVEPYPVAKPIRPQTILKVIVQMLTMPSGTSFDLISIKSQALRTIDALIVCLGANLLPFSPLIVKLVMATLKLSSDKSMANHGKVRCVAYNTLKLWLTILHVHKVVGREQWGDDLVAHILDDITPVVNIVQLQMNSNRSTKKLSKKAKRKMASTMLEESSFASHKPSGMSKEKSSDILNEEVAKEALECGETFLTVCGVFLKAQKHKLIQEHLVRECYTIEKYSEEVGLGLLRFLEAARRAPPPDLPPPTQYCLHLYSTLQNCGSPKISKFCSEALLNIRLHLHCSTSSINFALELSPQLTNDKDKHRSNGIMEDERNMETIIDITEYDILNNTSFNSKENNNEELNAYELHVKQTQILSKTIEVNGESNENSVEKDICEPLAKKMRIEDDISDNISSNSDIEFLINKQEYECNDSKQEAVESSEDDHTENLSKENESIENEVDEVIKINVAHEAEILKEQKIYEDQTQLPHAKDIEETDDVLTQMPVIKSNFETDCEQSQKSLEVVYDSPNTGQKVTVSIEKLEEPLPSSGDIDDVQISCGQVTVEDMLNDFVDEVVDDC